MLAQALLFALGPFRGLLYLLCFRGVHDSHEVPVVRGVHAAHAVVDCRAVDSLSARDFHAVHDLLWVRVALTIQ